MNTITKYFKNLNEREATKFLIIFFVVGLTGFLVPASRNIFERLIPVSLLINLFLLMLFHKNYNNRHIVFFLGVVVFTFVIEAIGVSTGLLFGQYLYGKSLPGKIFGTPVVIGFNWLMLTYGAVELIRKNNKLRPYLPIMVGLILIAFDFVMEPVAMKTGMWSWAFNNIPLQNYVMWFVISVVVASGFELFAISTNNKIAPRILILQALFFGILYLFLP